MSAPSDGARADARKARAAEVVAPDERIMRVLDEHVYEVGHRLGTICACGFVPTTDPETHATLQDYHRAHVAAALAGVVADAKAEGAREERLRLHHVPTANSGECSLCWDAWPCPYAWTEQESGR